VFSVTSETAANLSIQNAPSRSARTDPSAPDGFSALIDGNAAVAPASNDRPVAAAPDRPLQQRPGDASAVTDVRQPRDSAASGSPLANASSPDVPSNVAPSVTTDGSADTGTAAKPKLESAKSGIVKTTVGDAASDIIASPDTAAPTDPAASPQPAASTAVTPAPIAVAMAVAVAATDVVVVPVSNGNATQPLAIAAAAIATSTSTVEASKSAVAQAPIELATNAPASPAPAATAASPAPAAAAASIAAAATPATTSPDVTDPAAPAINAAQVTRPDAVLVPVNQPAPKADTPIQADPELAAAVAAASPVAPVAPRTTAKASSAARVGESAAPIKTGVASEAADPSAASPSSEATDNSVAPQGPAADGKQKTDRLPVDVANTDAASTTAPTAAAPASPHQHRAAATAQVEAEPSDPGQPANAVQQPQAQSATTPAAAPWSVTAATSAAVPLNGLALQIAVSAQRGNSRFEIRLDPAELGRIDVRIDVDRDGQVTSHLTVEKPETLAMLRQDAPQLQRALDNAGFKTGDGGLQFSLRDQSSSGQNSGNEAGRHAQRLIISEDDSVAAAVAGRTYGRMLGSSSGVDIRV
jgi:flagellar hook-length control protein FliK